jgi:hypothetical protein
VEKQSISPYTGKDASVDRIALLRWCVATRAPAPAILRADLQRTGIELRLRADPRALSAPARERTNYVGPTRRAGNGPVTVHGGETLLVLWRCGGGAAQSKAFRSRSRSEQRVTRADGTDADCWALHFLQRSSHYRASDTALIAARLAVLQSAGYPYAQGEQRANNLAACP